VEHVNPRNGNHPPPDIIWRPPLEGTSRGGGEGGTLLLPFPFTLLSVCRGAAAANVSRKTENQLRTFGKGGPGIQLPAGRIHIPPPSLGHPNEPPHRSEGAERGYWWQVEQVGVVVPARNTRGSGDRDGATGWGVGGGRDKRCTRGRTQGYRGEGAAGVCRE